MYLTLSQSAMSRYFQVPAANAPGILFRYLKPAKPDGSCCSCKSYVEQREKEPLAILYPKRPIVRRGLLVIPQEYIVVGEVYMDYSFLIEGHQFLLKSTTSAFEVRVRVLKNRRCGRSARPIVLLGAVDTESLEELTNISEVLQVTQIGTNILGEIQAGKANGGGSVAGHPNAYGHNRPVLPESLLADFDLFKLELIAPAHPNKLPCLTGERPVRVAILDTGLYRPPAERVLPSGGCDTVHTGWNFVDNTADVTDGHSSLHGTRITAIIEETAILEETANTRKLADCIPVKTAHDTGVCELYDVLCGLEYARVIKADVVNASFVFSSNDMPSLAIPLLHDLISVLENAGIWIVAAAGNAIQYAHDATGHIPPLGVGAPYLYPACYSRADDFDQILTVTTVSKRDTSFSLDECYSPTYVDIGVIANSSKSADKASFKAPGFPDDEPGTSYATAYMSGLVARQLAAGPIDRKTQLLNDLNLQQLPDLSFGIRTHESVKV